MTHKIHRPFEFMVSKKKPGVLRIPSLQASSPTTCVYSLSFSVNLFNSMKYKGAMKNQQIKMCQFFI